MSACASTEMLMFGRLSLNCSITCHWLQSSRDKFSVCMEVSRHLSTPLTRSANLTVSRKFPMKDPSATCFGLIPMTAAAGAFLPEVLATRSVKTSLNNSTMQMDWNWYLVLINLSWAATTGPMNAMLSQCSQHPTIVTDVVMKQLSWKLMNSWNIHCNITLRLINIDNIIACNLIQHQDRQSQTSVKELLIISCERNFSFRRISF